MQRSDRTRFRRTVWLLVALLTLGLPVLVAAHDHDDTAGVGEIAEECVVCHALGHKSGALPAGDAPLSATVLRGVSAQFPTLSLPVAHRHDPAVPPRGPPAD